MPCLGQHAMSGNFPAETDGMDGLRELPSPPTSTHVVDGAPAELGRPGTPSRSDLELS